MSVTQTGSPAARSASRSGRRFSSSLAITRSGASAVIRARSGFLVPPIRGTVRSAGWLHQSVTPTSSPGAVAATASVSEGTSDTTRRTAPTPPPAPNSGTTDPRSSTAAPPPGVPPVERKLTAQP